MFDPLHRRDAEQRARSEGRLPPGQSLTLKFPILHYGSVPEVNFTSWTFRIWGEVEKEVTLTWDEFNRLPKETITIDLHCVTRWSKLNTTWEGVAVRTMIAEGVFKPLPSAAFVMQHAENDYTVNLPLEIVLAQNFLLATHHNGEPIPPEHGYPLRGVVGALVGQPDLKTPYLWKGAKWLRGLEWMSSDRPGFWEQAGYHNEGDAWKEERFG